MLARTLISVEEYLHNPYRPDCDYIDGEVRERNVGELSHGRLQFLIAQWLGAREKQWGIKIAVEVRLRIAEKRFRIPDVVALAKDAPREEVVVSPPLLCVEILSRRDTLNEIWERTGDYFSIGLPVCWILDPLARRAWVATAAGLIEAKDGVLRCREMEMPLAEVWESAES